ncbi:MAG: hypothetical protein MUF59_09550, partial [Candidatus Krumholzibacteria bacterium]|nr:hypothetical protein [Candidatus Krumholzibacteria bacterium]
SVKWMAGIALAIPAAAFPLAAADLVYSGSALLGTGEYGLTERTTGFTFLNGLSLQVHSFRVSATIPLSGQSTALVSTTGAGIISSGGSSGSGTTSDDRPDRTGSGDDGIFSVFGVGDPSVRLDFDAIRSRGRIPSVSFFGQMKIPVADPADGLGTGEFDYSTGLSLAFPSGRNLILAEAAWWILGEMPDAELENPVSLNASLGRSFAGGRTMASLIFSGCTRIVPDTEPPMQAGAGFNILAGGGRAFGLSAMFGLTDSASDVSVSAGWTIPID